MKVIAYRGVDKTVPENTLQAFREAILEGAEVIQLDVHFSRDRKLVVFHDDSESRMIEGVGFVRHHTLDELQSYAFKNFSKSDIHIPSLEEYLEWAKDLPHQTIIHLKNNHFLYPGMEEAVYRMVEAFDLLDRVVIASSRTSSLRILRNLNPDLALARMCDILEENFSEQIDELELQAVIANRMILTQSFVDQLHDHHLALWTYVVNDQASLDRVQSFGAEGVLTRDVAHIRKLLGEANPYDKGVLAQAKDIENEEEVSVITNGRVRFQLGKKKKQKSKGGFLGIVLSMIVSIGASALAAFLVMKLVGRFLK